MKFLFVTAAVAILSVWSACAETQRATLTLEGDNVILETKTEIIKYPANKVPGFWTVKFEKKISLRGEKEINLSELTLEDRSGGKKLLLIESKAEKVIWDAKTSTWKPFSAAR